MSSSPVAPAAADAPNIANPRVAVAEDPTTTVSPPPLLLRLPTELLVQIVEYVAVEESHLFFFDWRTAKWDTPPKLFAYPYSQPKHFPRVNFEVPYLREIVGRLMINKWLFVLGLEAFFKGNRFDLTYASRWLKGVPDHLSTRFQHVELRINTDTFPDDLDFLYVVTHVRAHLNIKSLKLVFVTHYLKWYSALSTWAAA